MSEAPRAFAEPIGAAEKPSTNTSGVLSFRLSTTGLGVPRTDLSSSRRSMVSARPFGQGPLTCPDVCLADKAIQEQNQEDRPGFGIEKQTLLAVMLEALEEEKRTSSLVEEQTTDITSLLDSLGNRGQRVYRVAPVA